MSLKINDIIHWKLHSCHVGVKMAKSFTLFSHREKFPIPTAKKNKSVPPAQFVQAA